MKPYTKTNTFDGKKYKYPITSQETGNTYKVVIHPYGMDDGKYIDGCVVSLRKKGFLFSKEICNRFFDNKNGKIVVAYFGHKNNETNFDYNLVSMTNLIVQLYEKNETNGCISIKKLRDDSTEFSKWDGIV